MAIAEREIKRPKTLTFAEYLSEGETPGRYEIVDGVKLEMTGPSFPHQLIAGNILRAFQDYCDANEIGAAVMAPSDIVLVRDPLLVREPDVYLISFERLEDQDLSDPSVSVGAPELVVEVLSPSQSRKQIEGKVIEYAAAGVLECWLVSPEAYTVEVLKLTTVATDRSGLYGLGQTVVSATYPDLHLSVNRIFRFPKRSKSGPD